jgi:ABC-type sugar transport system ATPase subunit
MRLETTTVYVTHDQLEAMTMSDKIAVMDHGVVQQYATPAEVYNRPANAFVAGFIGSPPMNFLEATVEEGGAVALPGSIALRPAPAPAALAARSRGAVVLGVRPEHLTLEPDGPGGSLPATLEVREPLGNESLLYWATPAGAVVSRLAGDRSPGEGERATLHFQYQRLRWFDTESGVALE